MEKLNPIEVAAMPAAASENTHCRPFEESFCEPQMQREAQSHRQAQSEPEWKESKPSVGRKTDNWASPVP
jgi:hypothetical protein